MSPYEIIMVILQVAIVVMMAVTLGRDKDSEKK